jgi:hypothetical protein
MNFGTSSNALWAKERKKRRDKWRSDVQSILASDWYKQICDSANTQGFFARSGSFYIDIYGVKLRFSDHEAISSQVERPHFNFVDRCPSERELKAIFEYIDIVKHNSDETNDLLAV